MWKKLLCLLCVMTLLCGCGSNKVEEAATSATDNTITEPQSEMSEEEKKNKEFEGLVYIAASNLAACASMAVPIRSKAVISMDDYTYEMISDTMCKVTVTLKYEGHEEIPGVEATFDTTVDEWYQFDSISHPGVIGDVSYMLNGGATSCYVFSKIFD